MMRLSQLKVQGFRSLADVPIPLREFSILIGRNNAGKSNTLSAIKLLLEGTARDLSETDFFRSGDQVAGEIVLEADLEGVEGYLPLCDERHRTKIRSCLQNGSLRIRRIATRTPFKLSKLELWQPSEQRYGLPTGIENALKQILPECIFIEAFKDPTAEAQAKSTATLGKLLKQIVERVIQQIGEEVGKALEHAQSKLDVSEDPQRTGDHRPEGVKRVENRIRRNIRAVFESADVRLRFKFPDVQELISTTATLELKDSGPWTPPGLKGQGFQRVLYLALLRALAEEIRVSGEGPGAEDLHRPFILLFEEPEAFLHPALQQEMGEALLSIAETNQVVISTHSPVLVTPQRVENVIIVRQQVSNQGVCATVCTVPDLSALPDGEDKQLAAMLKYANSSEFLFADCVLVVEGPSDRSLLESCWSKLRKSPDGIGGSKTLAVIEAGSKHVVPAWLNHLSAMGITARGLVDLDFLWNGAGSCLKADQQLSKFMERFWDLAEERGISTSKDGQRNIPSGKKAEAFQLIRVELREMAETLRSKLREQGVWVLADGEIESYFGLSSSSKGRYGAVSREIRGGEIEVPSELQEVLQWVLR